MIKSKFKTKLKESLSTFFSFHNVIFIILFTSVLYLIGYIHTQDYKIILLENKVNIIIEQNIINTKTINNHFNLINSKINYDERVKEQIKKDEKSELEQIKKDEEFVMMFNEEYIKHEKDMKKKRLQELKNRKYYIDKRKVK